MATQDNDNIISFGTTTAAVNRPARWALFSAATGGTRYSANADLGALVDGDGNAITDATIASGTIVRIPADEIDLSETMGDLNEAGRARVLQLIVTDGWYVRLFDSSNSELTGSDGLTGQELTDTPLSTHKPLTSV